MKWLELLLISMLFLLSIIELVLSIFFVSNIFLSIILTPFHFFHRWSAMFDFTGFQYLTFSMFLPLVGNWFYRYIISRNYMGFCICSSWLCSSIKKACLWWCVSMHLVTIRIQMLTWYCLFKSNNPYDELNSSYKFYCS